MGAVEEFKSLWSCTSYRPSSWCWVRWSMENETESFRNQVTSCHIRASSESAIDEILMQTQRKEECALSEIPTWK